jgi:outer membrane receptor protein involved in Fe transport
VAVYRRCSASSPACTNVNGNHLPFAPETPADVDVSYTRPLNDRIKWFAGADYIYVGAKYADTANLLQSGSQELMNCRLGLTTAP